MLKRITRIKNIGLLHDVSAAGTAWEKATLIYAENGRGKSTLASVLRSCGSGDVALINTRKTLDSNNPPEVEVQFENGGKLTVVSYVGGAWTSTKPEILVFDAEFVEKNVYSGADVRPDQRQGLLEFALGQQAVAARKAVEETTQKASMAMSAVSSAEKSLVGYRKDMPLPTFIALPAVENPDYKIEVLRKRLDAANKSATLHQKAVPTLIPDPSFDIDGVFAVLSATVKDVEAGAEQMVRAHMAKHVGMGLEQWLNQGQVYLQGNDCPYCGQGITWNELIKAYQTHFNEAYRDLKNRVAAIAKDVEVRLADSIVERFAGTVEKNQAIVDAWNEHVVIDKLLFDKDAVIETMRQLRATLLALAETKQQQPLKAVGDDQARSKAKELWANVLAAAQNTNQKIGAVVTALTEFKAKLAGENVQQLQQQILRLEIAKSRHSQPVADLVNQLQDTHKERVAQDQAKANARIALDTLMEQVLKQYQVRINALLAKFGASYEIAQMTFNYYGATPRTEYGLRLRGKDVRLSGGIPSFTTALSEGDKRTLAFAFFVASVEADPALTSRVVIVDDPMCSLDRNRRGHTRRVLRDIGMRTEQLIVLGHDLYFLRDLRDDFAADKVNIPTKILKLARAKNNYTDFAAIDIDSECASDYYKNHKTLSEYIAGFPVPELRSVARAIRPLLEGYLHRRFPSRVQRGKLFGNIIGDAAASKLPDPLAHLQPIIQELNEVNAYAGQFHHNTNGAEADTVPIADGELKIYAARALTLMHKGKP